MEHIQGNWSADDIANVMSGRATEQGTKLSKLIEDIAGTPAGDWKECPLCLDVPEKPIMTICRHVFCADCVQGVFEMPAARGIANGEEDRDEDVEEIGNSIACPVCRHKLFEKDIGNFTPPEEKKTIEITTKPAKAIVW